MNKKCNLNGKNNKFIEFYGKLYFHTGNQKCYGSN